MADYDEYDDYDSEDEEYESSTAKWTAYILIGIVVGAAVLALLTYLAHEMVTSFQKVGGW